MASMVRAFLMTEDAAATPAGKFEGGISIVSEADVFNIFVQRY
jgi:hypothetical protein